MKLRFALAAATCLAVPLAAHAQPVTGPYVSLGGGTSILNPTNSAYSVPSEGDGEVLTGKYQFRPDYALSGGVGYGFGDGFRVELDGDYIRNTVHAQDLNSIFFLSDFKLPATGAEQKYGAMLNVLYDIPVGLPVVPYFGGGVGYQWVKFDRDLSAYETEDGFTDAIKTGGTQGSFAYDLIAGLSYPLPMVPGLSLTAEYRFMMLVQSRSYSSYEVLGGEVSAAEEIAPFKIKNKVGQESSSTFLLGLRYQLFPPPVMAPAPAPAPVAAPAPAPAKTYLVFFDWDKSTLTPRATQIIAEAASDSKTTGTTTIDVSGYTDTSGTPVYNQGLSERRAKAVAGQLVADGVPMSEIETHAFGETHLLVPTGPGVREPQNRRVEIVLD